MRDGFIRVASVSPDIRVCDVDYNKESIKKAIETFYFLLIKPMFWKKQSKILRIRYPLNIYLMM